MKKVLINSLISGLALSVVLLLFNRENLSPLSAVVICAIVLFGSFALGFGAYSLGLPPYADNDRDGNDNT